MAWDSAVYVIDELKEFIKGNPEMISSAGTVISGNAGTFQTVLDVTGSGEVCMLHLLGATAQGSNSGGTTDFRWAYRITIDGQVVTPDPTVWTNWKIDGAWERFFSAPLLVAPTSASGTYDSPRNWYLTPKADMSQLQETFPIRFSESIKVEIYFDIATAVNAVYRVVYNQR